MRLITRKESKTILHCNDIYLQIISHLSVEAIARYMSSKCINIKDRLGSLVHVGIAFAPSVKGRGFEPRSG